MARRLSALVGIVAIVALALVLMWWVYRHHERSRSLPDEPALVRNATPILIANC